MDKWLYHKNNKIYILEKTEPGTGATFAFFDEILEGILGSSNDCDLVSYINNYLFRIHDKNWDEYYIESVKNPNPSKKLSKILRKNKLLRILDI